MAETRTRPMTVARVVDDLHDAGMSHHRIAGIIGVSHDAVSKWARREAKPRPENEQRLRELHSHLDGWATAAHRSGAA